MGVIDIIIVSCFLPALYFGIKNGLLRQIIAAAVIFLGIRLSIRWADAVSVWLTGHMSISGYWTKIISFVLIFTAVAIGLNLVGKILEKVIKITLLGWLDRILGIVLSLFIFSLIISVLVYFVDSLNNLIDFIPKEKIEESHLYPKMMQLAKTIFPHLKEFF